MSCRILVHSSKVKRQAKDTGQSARPLCWFRLDLTPRPDPSPSYPSSFALRGAAINIEKLGVPRTKNRSRSRSRTSISIRIWIRVANGWMSDRLNGHPNQDDDGAGESGRVTNVLLLPVQKRFSKFWQNIPSESAGVLVINWTLWR